MEYIKIGIDCTRDTCGECTYRQDGVCLIFGGDVNNGMRLEICIKTCKRENTYTLECPHCANINPEKRFTRYSNVII